MSYKKSLRILAAALALLPVLSGCGGDEKKSDSKETPSVNQGTPVVDQENAATEQETIYVRTEAWNYNAEGEAMSLQTWKYDERGMMLSYETDQGPGEKIFNEELQIFEVIFGPIDGVIDTSLKCEYDDQGSLIYYEQKYATQSSLTEKYTWKYDGDRVIGLTICGGPNGNGGTFPDINYELAYDEAGKLSSLSYTNSAGEEVYAYKVEYDDEGRMTREIRYEMECDRIFDFTYNEAGLVKEFVFSRRSPSRTHGYEDREMNELNRIALEYTTDGQLLRFGDQYEYEYDDEGRLISKKEVSSFSEEEPTVYTFTYNGDIPVEASGTYIYDENGCLVKILEEDGSYTQYKYQALTLSKEDALRHRRQQQMFLKSPTSTDWSIQGILNPMHYTIPVPLDPRLLVMPVTEYNK